MTIFFTSIFATVALGTFAGHMAYDIAAGQLARWERKRRVERSIGALAQLADRVNEKRRSQPPEGSVETARSRR